MEDAISYYFKISKKWKLIFYFLNRKSRTCKCFSKFTGEDCSITAYMP